MNIAELSKVSKVSTKMIQYYECIGLIPTANQIESGCRTYTHMDCFRLQFIRYALELGFSIVELEELLGVNNEKISESADIKELVYAYIVELDIKIDKMLNKIERLKELVLFTVVNEGAHDSELNALEQADDACVKTDKG